MIFLDPLHVNPKDISLTSNYEITTTTCANDLAILTNNFHNAQYNSINYNISLNGHSMDPMNLQMSNMTGSPNKSKLQSLTFTTFFKALSLTYEDMPLPILSQNEICYT